MESQDYMDQTRRARDELDALLCMTRRDLPVLTLRAALGELNRWIDGWEPPPVDPLTLRDEWKARREAWRHLPRSERHRIVIEALGDDGLRLREIADRVDGLRVDWSVTSEHVQIVLYELLEAGEVRREKRLAGSRVVWHYCRTPVSSEVADLQRRLEEADDVR